ncbi:LysR family transcriptional regulator [Paraburkholderia sp. DHOC27]|uniref:helix-turn-helix domain-containing protein n=1 Tax=Paraburkholderia sp. DHOC27 TaxID=2303330 RepID=UPI000E3D9372|nr:LysR family transcriptional regulator [Paraburkholderia sp. DHOC27]RFU44303.1 LysR family transcriptional regulator [Paraburkholderia sp. DHOC27]
MVPLDWTHLRYVLAVARTGGYSDAGRHLNVDPAVVAKRIRAIESASHLKLFERTPDGQLRPTKASKAIIARAEIVESQLISLSDVVKGLDAS